MDFLKILNSLNIDIGLLLIEGIIIFSIIYLLVLAIREKNLKKFRKNFFDLYPLIKWVKDGENLCDKFLKFATTIESSKELPFNKEELKTSLNPRINNYSFSPTMDYPCNGSYESQIQKMFDAGYDISEIAKAVGLSPGEIRFIIDLVKYRESIKGKPNSNAKLNI